MSPLVHDDRITCAECARYDASEYEVRFKGGTAILRGRCTAARPPMGTAHDLARRCEYFNALPGAADQRKGIERWPELRDYPGGPARKPYPQRT